MFPNFEEKSSDSPLVERIWLSQSDRAGSFISIAAACWVIVISKHQGRTALSIHGPKTKATALEFPAEVEWFGIDLKLGTFMAPLPPGSVIDRYVLLPEAADHAFWLCRSAWQFPNYENADTFVDRLVRAGLLTSDPVVNAIHQGQARTLSLRTVQVRFRRSTGLSQRTIRQIERARHATALLKLGLSIIDTAYAAGYSDQPHLTRSLQHFIGHTPAEIRTSPIIALHSAR